MVSDFVQGLPVLLNLLSSILYARINTTPWNDKGIADRLKVDTIAKRLMSNQGKVDNHL